MLPRRALPLSPCSGIHLALSAYRPSLQLSSLYRRRYAYNARVNNGSIACLISGDAKHRTNIGGAAAVLVCDMWCDFCSFLIGAASLPSREQTPDSAGACALAALRAPGVLSPSGVTRA